MQNGNLKCNATECAYNQEHKCKAGSIHVSGKGATSLEGTTCLTFAHTIDGQEGNAFYNKANGCFVDNSCDSITQPSNIKCEAHNCIYNKNKDCHAKHVLIDENNAYCDSFNFGNHVQ